ncbi:hypothetical protein B0H39_005991 [Clostridium beijerinckii]|nr:hypothetical protein [Clostridium beijerinckii]NOW87960.1 hypothetical protein [Clostridium beijerinckii]
MMTKKRDRKNMEFNKDKKSTIIKLKSRTEKDIEKIYKFAKAIYGEK